MNIPYEYSIALLASGVGGLTRLDVLGVKWPADEPVPYSVERPDGDGGVRGLGWPVIRWHWGFITIAEWNILKPYCTGKSSDVIIRTFDYPTNQAFVNYSCKMIFPTGRGFSAGRLLDFTVLFQAPVLIP